jgi:preprotein translocase subunit SecE
MSKRTQEKRRVKKTVTRSVNTEQTVRPRKESFRDFLKGVWIELTKKVIWPSGKELWNYTIVVLAFVVFWAVYIGLWDMLFAKGLEAIVK